MIDSRITGAYISRLRRDKDWTQLDLADQLNVTHQAVSRWEKGDSFPDIAVLARMAALFGISVDDLLNGGPTAAGRPLLTCSASLPRAGPKTSLAWSKMTRRISHP
jgi:transcriptional regulator with XRE-family HTH domain